MADLQALPDHFDRPLLGEGLPSLFMGPGAEERLGLLEDAYRELHPARVEPDDRPRIPKIVHQIWLGSELPDVYARFREGWMELHPEWEFRLWTDEAVAELDFDERDLYEGSWNFAMKANILRAVVVRRFGGLYVDVDYECLQPLDPFHHRYDFYGTARPGLGVHCAAPWIYPSPFGICNSLFAARPGHPLLGRYLGKVRRLWPRRDDLPVLWYERIATLFDRQGRTAGAKRNTKIGFLPFGGALLRHMRRRDPDDRTVVLPPSFFNPVDTFWNLQRFVMPPFWTALARHAAKGGRGLPPYYDGRIFPHTFAVHHSGASWL